MSFVKLDCGILQSSLWVDKIARECFITALLMAVPKHIEEPVEQLDAKTMKPTGYVVPVGWYGFVNAAGVGIVRMAGIEDQAAGLDALGRLSSPESDSRSADHEGRRIARIDGGYLVLNFVKYRDKDHSAAERMRRYRERKKVTDVARNSNGELRNNVTELRHITQAEAEAEAEVRKEKPPNGGKKKNGSSAELFPADFALTEPMREQLTRRIPDADPEETFTQFRAHHESHGKRMRSWPQAWVTWIGNAEKFGYPKRKATVRQWD